MCVLPTCNPVSQDTDLQCADTGVCLGMQGTRLLQLLRILLITLLRHVQPLAPCVHTLLQAPY